MINFSICFWWKWKPSFTKKKPCKATKFGDCAVWWARWLCFQISYNELP